MEVEEEDSPRQSFSLKVYDAEMTVGDVRDLWRDAAEAYQIQHADFLHTFEIIQHKILGNISGGTSAGGKDFLTVYFDYTPT